MLNHTYGQSLKCEFDDAVSNSRTIVFKLEPRLSKCRRRPRRRHAPRGAGHTLSPYSTASAGRTSTQADAWTECYTSRVSALVTILYVGGKGRTTNTYTNTLNISIPYKKVLTKFRRVVQPCVSPTPSASSASPTEPQALASYTQISKTKYPNHDHQSRMQNN